MTTAPWLELAARAKWTALRHIEDVRPELRPLVLAHLEHLEQVLRRLRAERERRAA